MDEKKIKLSFVNGGKPFFVPHMTVKRQEELMESIIDIEKKYEDEKKKNQECNKVIVLKTLQVVDINVTMDDINNMHPEDFIFLFNNIWEVGRELTSEKLDFR